MAELSLVASAASSLAVLHPEQAAGHRLAKELQTLLPLHGGKPYALRSGPLQLNAQHLEDFGRSLHLCSGYNQSFWPSSLAENSVLIDVQDSRHENILKFLMSGSKFAERGGINISSFSDLMMEFHIMDDKFRLHDFDMNGSHHYLHPQKQLYILEPTMDFVGNKFPTSTVGGHRDGRLLFPGSGAEMKDLLSVLAEFSIPKRSINGSKKSVLVPYFTRKGRGRSKVKSQVSSSISQTQTVSPEKSTDNIEQKQLHKKKQTKKARYEQDLHQRNYFHACESLLFVILNKNRSSAAIVPLKKSGVEIGQFLSQFSAGIAGTGLAVIFSVLCKLACTRAPLCSTKLLNTGFSFGLFWLSWAVNDLRDTILHISKNSDKLKLKEEEVAGKVERSMNEILFRAVTLVAVAAFRLA